jgi:hypothetical protein
MTRARPGKKPRVERPENVDRGPDDDDEDPGPRKVPRIKNKVALTARVDPNNTDGDDKPVEEIEEGMLGFCCHICRCDPESEDMLPEGEDGQVHRYIQSCDGGLYHRCCCHGLVSLDVAEWATLYEGAVDKIGEIDDKQDTKTRWVTNRELYAAYETAVKQESAFYNADGDAHPLDRLMTHEDYIDGIVKPFEHLLASVEAGKTPRRSAVVLDAFAGMGTGIVVLKRLKIDIAKIVHVENDKVSTHVYRWNHDPSYNPDLPKDDVEQVFVDGWEKLDTSWKSYCDEHGRKSIILIPRIDTLLLTIFMHSFRYYHRRTSL